MRRFQLLAPAFIASTLLAEGSIITQQDLGFVDGKPQPPPSGSIEIDANGMPISEEDADLLKAALEGERPSPPIMPIPGDEPPAPPEPDEPPAPPAADTPAAAPPVQGEAPTRRGGK